MPPKQASSSSSGGITNTAPFKPPRPAARQPSTTNIPPSSPSDDEFGTALSISDDDLLLANPPGSDPAVADAASPPAEAADIPGIPPALLARIVHLNSTRTEGMSVKAREGLTAYVDVFIREAVARAAANVRAREGGKGGDVWVDAGDLEEVAPGLIMDF